jgi:hypothetical protein
MAASDLGAMPLRAPVSPSMHSEQLRVARIPSPDSYLALAKTKKGAGTVRPRDRHPGSTVGQASLPPLGPQRWLL